MSDNELLTQEERKEKIRKLTANLSARFNEMLWNDPAKVSKLEHYKPTVLTEFWLKHEELDKRCLDYLEGKIEWEGDSMQMDFTEKFSVPFPILEVERDVQNFERDLYVWLSSQIKDL